MKPEILKELFGEMTVYHLFLWLIFVAAVVGIIVGAVKLICKIAEKYRIDRTAYDQRVAQVQINAEAITELQETDKTVIESISKLSDKLDDLSDQVTDLQNANKRDTMHQTQDRILQMFKYYTDPDRVDDKGRNYWTNIERETYKNLLESYKANQGDSYVDEYVDPKMQELHVVNVWEKE